MSSLKIAVAGAGSYVFGPSILHQMIIEHRLVDVELALLDVDEEMVTLMAAVGRRMARESGVKITLTAHTRRETAFKGADFVVSAVIREMHKRFQMDRDIIDHFIPGHLQTEYGGISGISNSLRQIELVRGIAEDMERWCPEAWLLNIANPLSRVCQAAHQIGVKTVGFCAVALEAYAMTWAIIHGERLTYPFSPAVDQWEAVTAGLNHFVWLLALRERAADRDLLPLLSERIQAGATSGNPTAERMQRTTGYLLVPNDEHTQDFLPPQENAASMPEPSHGSTADRTTRLERLRAVSSGSTGWDTLLNIVSWERPIAFIEGIAFGKTTAFPSLNLINQGQISNLPRDVFVDTPVSISGGHITTPMFTLPSTLEPLCSLTAQVTDTIVRAGLQKCRALVHRAVELDPTITDKQAGIRAMDASLEANADLLGEFV